MNDYIIRAVDKDRKLRAFIATTTHMANEAHKIHKTLPIATAALGRTLTAASIMGIMLKGEKDKITLNFKGSGKIKSILAVANSYGKVKGYISDPFVELPLREDGKLDVGGAVGSDGRLVVIKDLGLKEPYVGQSKLVNGEIAQDLTHYFAYSEQQPSSVALGVLVDRDLSVKASGGFIIQVLPGITEEEINKLENNLMKIGSISSLIDEGNSPEDILNKILGDFHMDILDKVPVEFSCDCSIERIKKALSTVGKEELQDMIDKDKGAELLCHFCNTKYNFTDKELEEIKESLE
ncbi:Hsp33 family molecular chaperone HslO [Clostridiisalibacter paucivorans]|uniref:Hsp33 family molecular chaperone HslO n=1 Tax=Clostridiisalibacter paucivorans TaxID=408753 RepID=UPI00047C768B|nr:Hsp33 family molecular chaperone HslO [Clostridiisalibacter paucivorans]